MCVVALAELATPIEDEAGALAAHLGTTLYEERRVPWLLRERATSYAGLGRECAPSSFQNFLTTIARLCELAPQAAYDERLMAPRNVTGRTVRSTGVSSESVSVSSASGVDLLAHLLAPWLGQRGPQPSMKDIPVSVRITREKV